MIAPVTFPLFQPLYPHHPITSHHRQINHHHHFTSNSSPTSPQTPNSPNIKYPTLTLLLTPTLPQHLHSTLPLYHSHHYPHQPLCHRHHHFTYNSSPISPRNTFHSPLLLRTTRTPLSTPAPSTNAPHFTATTHTYLIAPITFHSHFTTHTHFTTLTHFTNHTTFTTYTSTPLTYPNTHNTKFTYLHTACPFTASHFIRFTPYISLNPHKTLQQINFKTKTLQ